MMTVIGERNFIKDKFLMRFTDGTPEIEIPEIGEVITLKVLSIPGVFIISPLSLRISVIF